MKFFVSPALILFALLLAADAEEPKPAAAERPLPEGYERVHVEEVLKAETDGCRFSAYIVRWHGERVVASNPNNHSDYKVGDNILIIVHKGAFTPKSGGAEIRNLDFMAVPTSMNR